MNNFKYNFGETASKNDFIIIFIERVFIAVIINIPFFGFIFKEFLYDLEIAPL